MKVTLYNQFGESVTISPVNPSETFPKEHKVEGDHGYVDDEGRESLFFPTAMAALKALDEDGFTSLLDCEKLGKDPDKYNYTLFELAIDSLHHALDWCGDDVRRGEIPPPEILKNRFETLLNDIKRLPPPSWESDFEAATK